MSTKPSANYTPDEFLKLLQDEAATFNQRLSTEDQNWIVKGFIDVRKRIYTISSDTKVVSKLLELMLLPYFREFAQRNNLKLVPTKEQNYYPDITFIDSEERKFAVDLKSTYYKSSDLSTTNTMTLGAFTGYFRRRDITKNITFPYGQYSGHFILGVLYSRADIRPDELDTFSIEQLSEIPSVVRNMRFFAQPKWRIAKDTPGAGNTKNIGAINKADKLINGTGPFADMGESVFDDYWMYYLTKDMARAVDLKEAPYNSLDTYLEYKKNLP